MGKVTAALHPHNPLGENLSPSSPLVLGVYCGYHRYRSEKQMFARAQVLSFIYNNIKKIKNSCEALKFYEERF